MKPLSACRLYTFIDTAYLGGRSVPDVARQLCAGGADLIQLRAKQSSENEILAMAHAILPITRETGVRLVINDYPEVATKVGAELCHLGQEDFFGAGHTQVGEVPGIASGVQIGLSTHAPDQAQRAVAAGAAYVAIGPVFATATKPQAVPVTLEYVRWAAKHLTVPWFAIGGINLSNVDQVRAAGAERICVVSAILQSADVTEACRRFRDRFP
jgi:thiamine-phosphate pyrophosphorylase